jgi:acetyl-CoA C-acetyltransferase
MMDGMNRVAVLGGNRIPFARVNTAYRHASNQEMLTAALAGLAERFGLEGRRPGLVVGGAVVKQSRDFNLVRESVLGTALDPATPCIDLQQACATSLQAAFVVANEIALGRIDCGIACGVDSSSDPPIGINEELRRILLDFNRARDTGTKLRVLSRLRPRHIVPALPGIREPRTRKSMGEHAEISARVWQIDRAGQDRLALESHRRLAAAWDRGFFNDLVTPFLGLERDNVLRPDTSLEKLASLAPAFSRDGTITAGNASALTDGAAAALLASERWATEHGHPVLAWLVEHETAAVDFAGKGGDYTEGLLMAPVYAVPRMLQRAGLTLQDFDFYEIHEAFAAQVLATLRAWENEDFCRARLGLPAALGAIDPARLNVAGSSLSTGHPFAATGARILATAAKLLAERGSGRALISVCAAGGQGVCAILER